MKSRNRAVVAMTAAVVFAAQFARRRDPPAPTRRR